MAADFVISELLTSMGEPLSSGVKFTLTEIDSDSENEFILNT